MKWIRERDALIAQTMAFVQSVTGKKDGLRSPEMPGFALITDIATVRETVRDATVDHEPLPAVSPPETRTQATPPPPSQLPPLTASPPRASSDVRSEMQARIANFRKHQERFEREREEYCAATLTKLRAAIRDPSVRPGADK